MLKNLIMFNSATLFKACNGDVTCILKHFKSWHTLPRGNSFILDLRSLLQDKNSSTADKALYLYLASLRNFFDYQYLHQTGLYIHFADISVDTIKNNNLLIIENDFIKFHYEEYNNGY